MAKAYVNDISQFLDVTNKENVKILKGRTTPEEIAKFAQIEGFDPTTEMSV